MYEGLLLCLTDYFIKDGHNSQHQFIDTKFAGKQVQSTFFCEYNSRTDNYN